MGARPFFCGTPKGQRWKEDWGLGRGKRERRAGHMPFSHFPISQSAGKGSASILELPHAVFLRPPSPLTPAERTAVLPICHQHSPIIVAKRMHMHGGDDKWVIMGPAVNKWKPVLSISPAPHQLPSALPSPAAPGSHFNPCSPFNLCAPNLPWPLRGRRRAAGYCICWEICSQAPRLIRRRSRVGSRLERGSPLPSPPLPHRPTPPLLYYQSPPSLRRPSPLPNAAVCPCAPQIKAGRECDLGGRPELRRALSGLSRFPRQYRLPFCDGATQGDVDSPLSTFVRPNQAWLSQAWVCLSPLVGVVGDPRHAP